MKPNAKALLLIGLLIPGTALAQITAGDQLGTTEADIRAAIEAQGYTITEIEFEDGEIEIEAMLDGQEYEIEIATDTGLVLEVEREDDEDDS